MSFSVVLYSNSGEENRVDKTNYLTLVDTLTGDLREQCSLVSPSITLQLDSVPTFNYVYIQDFHRYYFVRNIVSVNKNLWRIDLDCDVLMSYKNDILNLEPLIDRCEDIRYYNTFLRDENIIVKTGVVKYQINNDYYKLPTNELFNLVHQYDFDNRARFIVLTDGE